MIELFSLIQKYSVNTSHPYFFNQLFGATDPVALAAELISLSVNTSAYTYETAPIFTMMEREVVSYMINLVFGNQERQTPSQLQSLQHYEGDGIMIPGGSLSNLTALHIARYRCYSNLRSSTLECHGEEDEEEEKKTAATTNTYSTFHTHHWADAEPELVAFISEEAHYSFRKAAAVTGLKEENVITIPTLSNGVMDVQYLDKAIRAAKAAYKYPFFVGVTSGSTVRGSFDSIEDIVTTCQNHGSEIWIHVDGAWGGPALFSQRKDVRDLMKGIENVDSFTFNPHKMLGAPQQTTVLVSRHKVCTIGMK